MTPEEFEAWKKRNAEGGDNDDAWKVDDLKGLASRVAKGKEEDQEVFSPLDRFEDVKLSVAIDRMVNGDGLGEGPSPVLDPRSDFLFPGMELKPLTEECQLCGEQKNVGERCPDCVRDIGGEA